MIKGPTYHYGAEKKHFHSCKKGLLTLQTLQILQTQLTALRVITHQLFAYSALISILLRFMGLFLAVSTAFYQFHKLSTLPAGFIP
jgi:hypothetical protein